MPRNAMVPAAFIGGMAASAAPITLAGAVETDFGVIRARRIQLVDQQGNLRAELYLGDTDNSGNFRLFDAKNRLRVKLGTSLEGALACF